ncbi:DNA-directed DNA polymerase [Enterococcus saigonensis]|uniref:DNA polymerase III subunit alpha n=1 Tax=Enterococcus saigonensis TaxID=1805431 RepID=A0A679ICV5_9ENTE|nr:DNA-directed DNA polymerase [Enterococcus saigonensis]
MLPQLYTVTAYSLLQSTIEINRLVQTAKKRGYDTLGICDRNVLVGAVGFYNACQDVGLKSVIGLHLDYYSPVQAGENEILLFAKNFAGYQQLMALSSQKEINSQVDLADFAPLDNLYGVLPLGNEVDYFLAKDRIKAESRLKFLQDLFPKGHFFYGVLPQKQLSEEIVNLYYQNGVEPFAINKVSTIDPGEKAAIAVMRHLKNGTQMQNIDELEQGSGEYLINASQVTDYFYNTQPHAIENAQKVASICSEFELPLHQKLLPHYPVPENITAAEFLRQLCNTQLKQRVRNITAAYKQRLDYELDIIHQMGFDDYFLIVWDVMDFAHRNNIVTGAGRGSAAGSLVAFVLAITDVDPIEYELLFERFLNPERYTMPDIDLDIPDNRREEVLHYVKEKYGTYQVAQIATFGTMAAKMVLRDVARVFGLSQSEANRWSKAIPNTLKITLKKAYEESSNLRDLVTLNERNRQLFEVALILEGLPRHVSTHAAGVVISDKNLLQLIPLQSGANDILLTQFTMNDVETVGLLKMDFLGLRNLSIIDDTLKGIKKVTGNILSQKDIPLTDAKTLQLFQAGNTSGVFQFESAGIKNVLRRLGPENIEEIAAVNALYRPGPMQNIDHFIKRKKGQEKVTYLDDSLVPILKNTYGIMVYQEQVMQVAAKMAGFSLGQADILRRAISKKKKDVLDEERRHFVSGAVEMGHTKTKANEVYDYIERFADYGFNRSHAFAYSFVGFQMGFLKVHYPAPFFAALLHSVRNNTAKVKEYLTEAKKQGIKILPPTINASGFSFYLVNNHEIRFGLSSVKGTRRDFIAAIIAERKENGPFLSLDNFLYRLPAKWLKLDLIQPLVEIGAFDEIEKNRRQLAIELESKIQNIEYSGGSMDLLDIMTLKTNEVSDYTLTERLNIEEQYLGVYVSGHPTESYASLKAMHQVQLISELLPRQNTHLLLYVRRIREIRTKKGEQMAFVEANDPTGEISLTIFPDNYRHVRQTFAVDDVIYVEGKTEISTYNQEMQVIVDQLVLAEKIKNTRKITTCYIRLTGIADTDKQLAALYTLIKQAPGASKIILFYESTGTKKILAEKYQIADSPVIMQDLKNIFGENNVVFK